MTGRRRPARLPALLVASLLASLLAAAGAGAATERPNVVLIVGDDLGWPYYGFMGDAIARTPHLDALAAGGTVFRNAHVTSSVCMPSLRALLAGVHTTRWDAERTAIEQSVGPIPHRRESAHFRTLPRELARRGYVSWEGGKMWEGTYRDAGFTHGLATSVGGPFSSVGEQFGRTGWAEGTALDPLRDFLDEAGEQPFFVWFAPMLPHGPFNAPADLRAPFELLGLPRGHVAFRANVAWLDALVGALVAELEERGLRERTLLVYLHDNGWEITQGYGGFGHGKGTLYELGYRSPLVFSWPGRVPAQTRDDLVSSLDVVPTILAYAGAEPLSDRPGRSLVAAIESGSDVGRERIVSSSDGRLARNRGFFVRTRDWRYVASEDGPEELYAIADDPYEEVDLAASHPELLPGFRDDVAAWQAELVSSPERLDATGVLEDASGAPIAGAELGLSGRADSGRAVRLRVLTGPDGSFRFASVPRGLYETRALKRARELRHGASSGAIPTQLPVGTLGSHMPLTAVPRPAPREANDAGVHGVVRTRDGEPLAYASITLRGRSDGGLRVRSSVLSGDDGRFLVENLPPGGYRLRAKAGARLTKPRLRVVLARGDEASAELVAEPR